MNPTSLCHVVAMPYPGRGHINPMMNLCKLIACRKQEIIITFVVTEEWLGYIGSNPKPDNIRFRTLPNVIPSERTRAQDFPGFYEAVMTKMEAPFEQLLDRLEPPVTAIMGDIELRWAVNMGNRRNIPVAALWTSAVSFFSILYHFYQFWKENHSGFEFLDHVDNIPGISSSNIADLRTLFHGTDHGVLQLTLNCISRLPKAQWLLFNSIDELEPQVSNNLSAAFPFPVYSIGPAIPYLELEHNYCGTSIRTHEPNYIQWLDSKPANSVLYISLGSFLSVSSAQMDEILAGLQNSGVCFMWVTREEASRWKEICGDKGLVVPWCDQLRVLCHSSVGGFWTHCGWNSTLEAAFAGVPMLTFPLFFDQDHNRRKIVEDWKIGCRVKGENGVQNIVTREEIADLVQRFMDLNSSEGKEMRNKARQVRDICQGATAEGGSSASNLDAFIRDILQRHGH